MTFLWQKAFLFAVMGMLLPSSICFAEQADAQFKDVEIRVIRPKYFQKSMRLEVGAGVGAVMNGSYTYTYLPSVRIGFHTTEWLEIFGEGSLGLTINKSDCIELGSKFSIEPVVREIQTIAEGGVTLTPIYGKYQVSSGDVIYFDWFLVAGGGMASMKKREQGCKPKLPDEPLKEALPYVSTEFNFGTGQRFFINKNTAITWFLRDYLIRGRVDPNNPVAPENDTNLYQSVTLTFGASYFL